MNWPLVGVLALPSLVMAVASLFGWTERAASLTRWPEWFETGCWLALTLVSAVAIARFARRMRFLHGLVIGLAWGTVNAVVHVVFFGYYIAHNPMLAQQMQQGPTGRQFRAAFLILGIVFGLVNGLVLGLLAWLTGKFVPRPGEVAEGAET
jgi:hypothetical protein